MIELKSVKKEKNKYLLEFSTETLTVFEEVIIKYMLLSKRDIDETLYYEIKKYANYIDNLHLCIDYLKKPRTKKEVIIYLKKLGSYDKNIIDKLEDMNLINDYNYMLMYVDYESRINLKGPNLIKKELELKGITLDFTYPNYDENINKLINKFLKNNKDKPTKMLNYSLNNYLINKGYNKVDEYYYNDDNSLIQNDIDKLLIKSKKYKGYDLKKKLYSSLINKGYESGLINEYLDKLL